MMATNAVPVIEAGRPKLAADVLWLGSTAFVFAVILVIVCWPLSAALSVHNPPDAAANQPAASLTSGTTAGSATVTPLPALAGGDRITRPGALRMPGDVVGEGSSNVAPPSPIATPGELARDSLTPPDRSLQAAQAAPATAAISSPATHRMPQHKPRPRPVAPKAPPQPTRW
jgi:hypothetical protein